MTIIDQLKRVTRFAVVGLVNTAVDLGVLLLLVHIGVIVFWANVVSTTVAFLLSYVLNRVFVFRQADTGLSGVRQFVLFAVITFTGLWLIQPLIILGIEQLIAPLGFSTTVGVGIGKIVATGVTMVWNYVLYGRFAFREH